MSEANDPAKMKVGAPGDITVAFSPFTPSRSLVTALQYVTSVAEQDHGLRNGTTALYWHLLSVTAKHIGDSAALHPAPEKDNV